MAYGYDPDPRKRQVDPYSPPAERTQFSSGGLTQGNTGQAAATSAASGGETQAAAQQGGGLLAALAGMRGGGGASGGGGGGGGLLSGIAGLLKGLNLGGGSGAGGGGGSSGYMGTGGFSDAYGPYEYGGAYNTMNQYPGDWWQPYGETGYETYGWD